MKQVEAAVHHTIKNYNATSKSKSLWRLTPKNESRIAAKIVQAKEDKHLLELIHKRDHYTNKIHEMLQNAAEIRDPALIDDLKEAEFYIKKRISRSDDAHQIRALILKHKQFQEDYEKRHRAIVDKYATENSYGGLEKLASMQKRSQAQKLAEKDRELHKLYREMARKQRELAVESESLLRVMKVPFFCGDTQSSDSEAMKIHVLGVLTKELGRKNE